MIPFFRKIRKKMADDNKPTQYARYAIGEIVLVVIGILIALQINNWNEEMIEKRKEQSVLIGLHETFSNNLYNLKMVMEGSRTAFDSSKKLLTLIGPNASDYTSTEVDSLISDMINYSTYDPSTGTIDDIINSGKLNIIQNQELKANISNWSGMLEDANKDILILNNHIFNVLVIYLNDKINFKNVPIPKSLKHETQLNITEPSQFPNNYEVFMRSKEFENLVDFHALNLIYLIREYLKIKNYLEVNLGILESEIKG
jgi:hypothetical protein